MAVPPPMPRNEPKRLDALRRLELLDSAADPAYEALAKLAARLLGTPMAAVSLIDAERQWTKAGVGLRPAERQAALGGVLEQARDAFLRADDGGCVLAFNRRAEELFGWERDAIIGRRVLDTLVPEVLRDGPTAVLAAAVLAGEQELP